jgi:hypothetical protein
VTRLLFIVDIVVHQIIRVSRVIVTDILDSDHLPTVFHILDHVSIRNLSQSVEKFNDWDRFQILASELISPEVEINSGEADKAARDFTASIASACGLSKEKNYTFRYRQRLRKL